MVTGSVLSCLWCTPDDLDADAMMKLPDYPVDLLPNLDSQLNDDIWDDLL